MTNRNLQALSERERECLAYLEEAKRLGVSFSEYCREKELSAHQWRWVKRALVRKGAVDGRRRTVQPKAAAFLPVRVARAPTVVATVATSSCRIRHPSGWTIECAGYPAASWLSALVSGETR